MECMATDPAARPSAEAVVRRLEAAPVGGLQKQGDSAGGASVASSIAGVLQRQGDSAGGISVTSSVPGDLHNRNDSLGSQSITSSLGGYLLQRQGDSAGGLSVASSVVGTLHRQPKPATTVSMASNGDVPPGLLPVPATRHSVADGKQQPPASVSGELNPRTQSTGTIELACFGHAARLVENSGQGSFVPVSGAPLLSSLSAGERSMEMPRSYSSAISVPSTTGTRSGTLSVAAAGASRTGLQQDGSLEGCTADIGGQQAIDARVQSVSAIIARASEPTIHAGLCSVSKVSPFPDRLGFGVASAEVATRRVHAAGVCDPVYGAAMPEDSAALVSPFVACRQGRQRRLPVSPFCNHQ